jgi:hypothetical protein
MARRPQARGIATRARLLGVQRLQALLEFGQRRGLMRAELDTGAAAFLIHHAIDTTAMQLLVLDRPTLEPDRVLATLTDMICRTVLEEER